MDGLDPVTQAIVERDAIRLLNLFIGMVVSF